MYDVRGARRRHPPSTRKAAKAFAARLETRRWVRSSWRTLPLLLVPFLFVHVDVHVAAPDRTDTNVDDGTTTGADVLPLNVNDRVRAWMKRLRTDQRAEFEDMLRRRGKYEGLIRQQLRQRGMPEELLYLAMIESGLMPRAESSASAVGIWQLMAPTAEQYGLRIDRWVDERKDPVRATAAALDYLSWLYNRYDSWYLAAAAYDAGPARVDRALALHPDTTTHGEDRYWEVAKYLPLETRQYVPRLIAAGVLAQDADSAGFDNGDAHPYRYDRVFVPAGTSLRKIAHILGVDTDVMRGLNPFLIQGVTPPNETYPVRVPVGDAAKVVRALGSTVLRKVD
jgi:membrane-bound lytic murein transglycosylase D